MYNNNGAPGYGWNGYYAQPSYGQNPQMMPKYVVDAVAMGGQEFQVHMSLEEYEMLHKNMLAMAECQKMLDCKIQMLDKDMATMERSLQEERQKRNQYLGAEAYAALVPTERGMIVFDKKGNSHTIFNAYLKGAMVIHPHPYYGIPDFYVLVFRETDVPLIMTQKELQNLDTFAGMLEAAVGEEIKKVGDSRKKPILLIRDYIIAEAGRPQRVPFYAGWQKMEGGYQFFTMYQGATHGCTDPMGLENNWHGTQLKPLPQRCATDQVKSAQRVFRLMHCISSETQRSLVFFLFHLAGVYTLLRELGCRLNVGFCFFSNDPSAEQMLKELMCWFGDKPISMEMPEKEFLGKVRQRKDQPMVLSAGFRDKNACRNLEKLESALDGGTFSGTQGEVQLLALPVILGSNLEDIVFARGILTVELQEGDLGENAIVMARKLLPHFRDYLENFMEYTRTHIKELEDLLAQGGLGLSREDSQLLDGGSFHTLTICRGLRAFISGYLDSLGSEENLSSLADGKLDQYLLTLFQRSSPYQDEPTVICTRFCTTVNRMIQEKKIAVYSTRGGFPNSEGAEQLKVLKEGSQLYFLRGDFGALCTRMGYNTINVLKALKNGDLLIGAAANKQTYLTRKTIYGSDGISKVCLVYGLDWDQMDECDALATEEWGDNLHLCLGYTTGGTPVYWNGMGNYHAYVTGISGTGKSYCLKNLIRQLPEQGARCIIFDYSGDFQDVKGNPPGWPSPELEYLSLNDSRVALNPFVKRSDQDSLQQVSNRISDMLKRNLRLGENQWACLSQIINYGMKENQISSMDDLYAFVVACSDQNPVAKKLVNKIWKLASTCPSGDGSYSWNVEKPGITVIDLSSYDSVTQNLLTEFIMYEICSGSRLDLSKTFIPLIFVVDECQKLQWKSDSMPSWILREGRKHQIGGWFSTQWISDRDAQATLEEADLRLIFRPEMINCHKTVRALGMADKKKTAKVEQQLSEMKRGHFMAYINGKTVFAKAE